MSSPAPTTAVAAPSAPARRRQARLWLWPFLVVAVAALAMASLAVGSRDIPLAESARRFIPAIRYAFDPSFAAGYRPDEFTVIIANLRIPRTLLALLAGMALGVAGTLIQGHTRNPLADPGLLGINAGAALATVGGVYWGLADAASTTTMLLPALVGAAAATALVFALSSSGTMAANPVTLVLAGTAVTALLMALVNAMVITDAQALDTLRNWATGSVAGRPLSAAAPIAPLVLVGLVVALWQAPKLNLLALGEETAKALGVSVGAQRVLSLAAISVLGSAAVCAAGPLAFLGLAAPHAARALWGTDYRRVIPGAMLLGGALALVADVFGRVAATSELPMGIVLGVVGVPLFIVLIKRGSVIAP